MNTEPPRIGVRVTATRFTVGTVLRVTDDRALILTDEGCTYSLGWAPMSYGRHTRTGDLLNAAALAFDRHPEVLGMPYLLGELTVLLNCGGGRVRVVALAEAIARALARTV